MTPDPQVAELLTIAAQIDKNPRTARRADARRMAALIVQLATSWAATKETAQ